MFHPVQVAEVFTAAWSNLWRGAEFQEQGWDQAALNGVLAECADRGTLLPALTGGDLMTAAQVTPNRRAPGWDNWAPAELKTLSRVAWGRLADMLESCEQNMN